MPPFVADHILNSGLGDFRGMAIGLAIFNALWFVSRRVRTFAEDMPDLSLGWLGLVIVPMRLAARIASWVFGFAVFVLFVTDAQASFNIAVLAVFVGFAVAYGINYVISRYENTFTERRAVARE